MFYVCISRYLGNALSNSSPLGTGTLLAPVAAEATGWYGATETLVGSGLVAAPISVQWISFPTEADATAWLGMPSVAPLLATALVSGYNAPSGSNNVALVVHRWRAWQGVLPSRNCNTCPPALTSGMPSWFGSLLPNRPLAAPVQTQVLMFADQDELAIWMNSGVAEVFLDNTLYTTRIP